MLRNILVLNHKAEWKPLLSLFLPPLIGNFVFLLTECVNRIELPVISKKFTNGLER